MDNRLNKLHNHHKQVIQAFEESSICVLSFFDECDKPSIQSHSISATNLRLIADNRDILRYGMSMLKGGSEDFLEVRPMSVRVASAFKGFCRKHDQAIFQDIDQRSFEAVPRNLALYLFRGCAQEMYKKARNLAFFSSYDIVGPDLEKDPTKEFIVRGQWLGLRDIHSLLSAAKSMIQTDNYDDLRYAVIHFNQVLPFAYLGAVNFDFFPQYGNEYELDDSVRDGCILATIPMEGGSRFILAWMKGYEKSLAPFVRRFRHAKVSLPEFVLQIGLEHCENLFFNPSWFRSLPNSFQERMKSLMLENILDSFSHPNNRPLKGIFDADSKAAFRLASNSLSFKSKWKK